MSHVVIIPQPAKTRPALPPGPSSAPPPTDQGLFGSAVLLASRAGELRRNLESTFHRLRHPAPRRRTARMLVVVPAHNEGDRNWQSATGRAPLGSTPIERTLATIEGQTRRPDRVLVVVNNSTDDTEARARTFKWATVVHLRENTDRKVGALNYAWQEWSVGYDFIAGVDADTELDPECLAQLEAEIVRRPQAAGIMARYTMRQEEAATPVARLLVRAQRLDFSSWVDESLARNRDTYVLGGQATLFRRDALAQVTDEHHRAGPWDPAADVEDMELTWRMKEHHRVALTSAQARAYVGAMHTLRSFWAQRLKWSRGMAALLRSAGVTRTTMYPWKQQAGIAVNAAIRLALAFLLPASLIAHQYVWSWFWLTPVALAWVLNVRSALRVPGRTRGDVVQAALLLPAEIYLWFQIAVTTTAWFQVLSGSRSDAWAAQSRAESGGGRGWPKVAAVALVLAAAVVGVALGWERVDPRLQARVLITGWSVLSVLTLMQCVAMLRRIFRRYHGLKP